MAKQDKSSSTSVDNNSKGQIREGHKIGDNVKAWQPTRDRTSEPPKETPKDNKK